MEMIFGFTFFFLVYTVSDMEAPMEKMNMKEVEFFEKLKIAIIIIFISFRTLRNNLDQKMETALLRGLGGGGGSAYSSTRTGLICYFIMEIIFCLGFFLMFLMVSYE